MTTETGQLVLAISIIVAFCILCGFVAYELIVYPDKYKNWNKRRIEYRRFLKDEKSRIQVLTACRASPAKILESIMPAAENAVDEEIKKFPTVDQLSKNPFWKHYTKLQEQTLLLKPAPVPVSTPVQKPAQKVVQPTRINIVAGDDDD